MNRFLTLSLTLLLVSCAGISVPVLPGSPQISPSPSPAIRSPTLPFIPSVTDTTAETMSPTWTETLTQTITSSPESTSDTSSLLTIEITGCNTSLDISHGMGEVTNAYPLLKNESLMDLNNVCASLTASDEGRPHPDKTICVDLFPSAHQVILKLTVDTGFQEDTSIQVDVTTSQGLTAHSVASSCRDLGLPGWIPSEVGVIQPLP